MTQFSAESIQWFILAAPKTRIFCFCYACHASFCSP